MAMADAKGSLDHWRKFFSSAKANIFDLIEKAILVAAADRPKEFMDKKDLIVEKLYTSHLSDELQVLNNGGGDESPKEEENSSNCDNPVENDQIAGEVMRIKEVLRNHQHESDSDLFESLRILQLMNLSAETLKETEIGKTMNALRKHEPAHIGELARTLIDGWKVVADEWSKSKAANEITVAVSETRRSSHSSAVEVSEMAKLENTKRKLHEGYQRIENAKKQRRVRVIEPRDAPKDSFEKRQPNRRPCSRHGN